MLSAFSFTDLYTVGFKCWVPAHTCAPDSTSPGIINIEMRGKIASKHTKISWTLSATVVADIIDTPVEGR